MLALDRAQRESVKFLTFMCQYICLATSAGRKAWSLSTNTAQSVDRLSTNKADQYIFAYTWVYFQTLLSKQVFFGTLRQYKTIIMEKFGKTFLCTICLCFCLFFSIFRCQSTLSKSLLNFITVFLLCSIFCPFWSNSKQLQPNASPKTFIWP